MELKPLIDYANAAIGLLILTMIGAIHLVFTLASYFIIICLLC